MMSMFACVLACSTAAARVLLTMSHKRTHPCAPDAHPPPQRNASHRVLVTGIVTFVLTVALACARLRRGHLRWMGSLATYGFLTAYALVCLAVPSFLRRERALTPLARPLRAGFIAMLLAIAGSVYPVPQGAYAGSLHLPHLPGSWLALMV